MPDEPLCLDCTERQGLCRFHERHVLPQLAQPGWTKMIGEMHVCSGAGCGGHAKCAEYPQLETPRTGCQCHQCTQRRLAKKLDGDELEPDAAVEKAKRRDARRQSKGTTRPIDRLARATKGAFTRSRSSRRVA